MVGDEITVMMLTHQFSENAMVGVEVTDKMLAHQSVEEAVRSLANQVRRPVYSLATESTKHQISMRRAEQDVPVVDLGVAAEAMVCVEAAEVFGTLEHWSTEDAMVRVEAAEDIGTLEHKVRTEVTVVTLAQTTEGTKSGVRTAGDVIPPQRGPPQQVVRQRLATTVITSTVKCREMRRKEKFERTKRKGRQ